MNSKFNKSKALRLGAFVLATGAALATTGCKSNYDKLFFTVSSLDKQLEITFCDRGASIYSMYYTPENGTKQCVTYQPQDKATFVEKSYYGKCLGRIAGRIANGEITVGAKDYQIEVNETARGKNNALHGGTNGMSTKDWSHTVVEKKDHIEVIFKYISPAFESGFPEALNAKYTFKIYNEGKLDLVIDASADGVTPVDLSYHPYFRLGTTKDNKTVLNHTLYVPAENMAQYDPDGWQTVLGYKDAKEQVTYKDKEGKEITCTPWNFQEKDNAKQIGKDIEGAQAADSASNGYDHIWYFGANENTKDDDGNSINTVKVVLKNPDNNLELEVSSPDSDGVIMYSNCYPEDQKMNDGEPDAYGNAITIEPYTFFTTDNASFSKLYIDKAHPFSRHITYQFSQTE